MKNISRRTIPNVCFALIIISALLVPLKDHLDKLDTLDKSFKLRASFVTLVTNFRYRVLNDRLFNRVLRTDENWLIYTDENNLSDYQGAILFSKEEQALIHQKLDTLQQELANLGTRLYVVVPPNKETIYPEKVPTEVPVLGEISRLDQLVRYQENYGGFQIIDLRPALLKAKLQEPVYSQTDTHWNSLGAWVGYYQVANTIAKDFPIVVPHELGEFSRTTLSMTGDLSRIAGNLGIAEESAVLTPKFKSTITVTSYKENDVDYQVHENADQSLPTAVVFRDSFFDRVIPTLSTHFSRIVYVSHVIYDPDLVARENPDIVIIERAERYLFQLRYLP